MGNQAADKVLKKIEGTWRMSDPATCEGLNKMVKAINDLIEDGNNKKAAQAEVTGDIIALNVEGFRGTCRASGPFNLL